ncbi:hypothetical protein SLS60_002375 [Paraconiothyrium brasiliense]|uniref:Uncharacterized protein n=1 Tax=Paraconiothyrium brasiliense TaxID=300254 RepID=A0ABR3S1Z8_9PLEO
MADHIKTELPDMQLEQPVPEVAERLEMPAQPHRNRAMLRPAPLKLEGTGFDGHPRISPLPPTPQHPTVRKRKNPPTLVERRQPYLQQKEQPAIEQRSPVTPSAKRVRGSKRAGPNDLEITMNDQGGSNKGMSFPFMELPGEIRNMIYGYCVDMSTRQALVVHLPKTGTLRSSTRRVRSAPGKYRELEYTDKKTRGKQDPVEVEEAPPKERVPRESNRPFVGLTQVCQQIRKEFYPFYIGRQEIGMDLTNTSKYIETFFNPHVPFTYADSVEPKARNMPFRGNITIAVADKILAVEKMIGWIDVLPLLNTWANSAHIEAGFGRYSSRAYHPQTDGEAKDMYRLYGRKVLMDRSCTEMNKLWRVVLRNRQLAAVRVHRQPGPYPKPYFHLIWKYEHRASWMTSKHSSVPGTVDARATPGSWLWNLGFDRMEHFDVRVGAEEHPGEFLFSS